MSEDDDTEPGPDANAIRKHAKRMLTEQEYRRKYRRIDFYRPNSKQLAFHDIVDAREIMLRAGNQQGKTQAGAAQLTFDLLGAYPDWHRGRHFLTPPAIERPFNFLAWCASTTSVTTRDGIQTRLLGNVRDRDGLGTGLVPLDYIRGTTMATDTIYIVHALRLRRMLPQEHVRLIQRHECGDAPIAWPHDGGRGGFETGETFRDTYKRLGLNMLSGHAQFPNKGGFNFEAGLRAMEERFATGRLRVASHLTDWFEEYRTYHRVNGLVHKVDDDLLSATRVLVMDIRRAQILGPRGSGVLMDRDRDRNQRFAKGTEQNQPFDLFTGRPLQ